MSKYEVNVSNVGAVLATDDVKEAWADYEAYCNLSKNNVGRVAGEDVVLWEDGEPVEEFEGSLSKNWEG